MNIIKSVKIREGNFQLHHVASVSSIRSNARCKYKKRTARYRKNEAEDLQTRVLYKWNKVQIYPTRASTRLRYLVYNKCSRDASLATPTDSAMLVLTLLLTHNKVHAHK